MIRLVNIKKKYVGSNIDVNAVNGISLEIEDGEMVAIMGSSGSGKTTLLNIIGCMDTAPEGEYYYNERPVHTYKNKEADDFRRENIGFVFQNFALIKDYTVRENVDVPLRARNIKKKDRRRLTDEMLEKVGIYEYRDTTPTKISGGQQQRCAIARALVSGASVILADEPTGALDSKTGQEIMDLLKAINSEGKTVIIVTHDEKIASQAQRIIRIEDGKVVYTVV